MKTRRIGALRSLAAILPLATFAAGCAGNLSASGVDGETKLPPRFREVSSPKVCLAKRRLLEELGHKDLADAAATAKKPAQREPELDRDDPPEIQVAYGAIAPATVLIRTSEGMGSGVIVDARGYVVTNQHVIDEFLQPDLTIKVSLELAEVGPTGRVVPAKKVLEGVVVKADPVRDLALVKIVNPPANLPVATLAPIDPRVGERVLSVGNAGIGLLWAAKVCNVSRIGDLTRETSMLEAGDCTLRDPGDDDEEAKRKREQCEARKKEVKKNVEESPQGLSIQTTCALNGGDSGGPLVNAFGEIVGLNESVRGGMNSLAFHVHVAEIREFLAEMPTVAAAIVPDPFCEGGVDFQVEDLDGDGVIDAASAEGMPHFDAGSIKPNGTYLFDLEQRTMASGRTLAAARPFAADVAVLLKGNDAYAFYDRDGDGEFDFLLRDRKADGKPDLAYALKGASATKDPGALPSSTLDPKLLAKAAAASRLGALAASSGLSRLASAEALASAEVPPLPNVAKVFGKRGHVWDVDDDKTPEAIFGSSGPQQAYLFDVRSPALRSLKPGDDASPILDPWKVTPQFVLLERPAGSWAIYDKDADGTFDMALFGKRPPTDGEDVFDAPDFATHAFAIEGGKLGKPLPELLGRGLTRSDLVTDDRLKEAMSKGPMSRSSSRGGFPDPFEVPGIYGDWTFKALEKDRQVLEQSQKRNTVVLVDLDRDTKKLATSDAQELAFRDKFDAEVAVVRRYDAAWAYYDTNGDGAFDVVLFAKNARSGKVDNAVRLTPDGRDAGALAGSGGLFRPDLVKSSAAAKARLEALFEEVLAEDPPSPSSKGAPSKGAPPPPPPTRR